MEPYDILMLVVLGGATVFGAWKGMAWQLASLSSLVVSYLVAVRFSADLAPYFGTQVPLNRFVAMLVLYGVTSLGIWFTFRVISGWLDRCRLKEFDRHVGGLFGAAKGILLCIGITFFAVTLSEAARETVLRLAKRPLHRHRTGPGRLGNAPRAARGAGPLPRSARARTGPGRHWQRDCGP